MDLIRLQNVTRTFRVGDVNIPVLKETSFSIQRGELVAIIGASGSGKSTLMNILGCLDRPTSGEYWLDGLEVSQLGRDERSIVRSEKLGFVFQNFNLLARTSAINNVLMPVDYSKTHPKRTMANQAALKLLQLVGLGSRLHHTPSKMSGGQQQRVAIARALINQPTLLLADEPTGNLDSQTSQEILRMFQELNSKGLTIILVTHDPKVTACADRRIRLHDGYIVEDTTCGRETVLFNPAAEAAAANATTDTEPKRLITESLTAWLPPTTRTAVSALWRNKMRSTLTTLGVIIGVAAVIAMVEISQGSRTSLAKTMETMGANTLMVQSGAAKSGGITMGFGTEKTLTPGDADAILQECPAITAAAPIVQIQGQVVRGNQNWVPMNMYGTTPDYLRVMDWTNLSEGEIFSTRDVRASNKVCVLGQTIVKELFDGQSPVGKHVRIKNVSFRVVGVLSRKGANMMGIDQDDIILAPWTTIKYRVSGTSTGGATVGSSNTATGSSVSTEVNSLSDLYPPATSLYPTQSETQAANTPQPIRMIHVDQIMVKAASAESIPAAITQIESLLHDRHRIRDGQDDDFNINNMSEILKAFGSMSTMMGGLLLIVATISLAVGGVGIMNIMLVSVTERTREIGVRMAVGARTRHILRQFLVEAIVLCCIGGLIGILLGRSASLAVKMLLHWPIQMSILAVAMAFLVSATVGVAFGFYPAWKASRLDPIEALRYE